MCGGGGSPGDGSTYDGEGGGSASAGAFNNATLASDVQAALDAEMDAGQRATDVTNPSLSQQGQRTFDMSNGWGLSFDDRVGFAGYWGGMAPYGAVARGIGSMVDRVVENPFATVIDVLASIAPLPAGPVGMGMALGRTAIGAGAMLGLNPSIGQMTTSVARGLSAEGVPGAEPGSEVAEAPQGQAPGAPMGLDTMSGNDSAWSGISDMLQTGTSVSGSSSPDTVPSTVSSLDLRSSYGFSPGQAVDYARLSGGFGGSNVGSRAGWRSGASGGWG